MRITVLGCGTYTEFDKCQSSYLAEVGDDNLLFDIGRGAISGLYKVNKTPEDIDAIFLTHMHPDHSSELIQLMHGSPGRRKPLKIYAPRGSRDSIERLLDAYGVDNTPECIEINDLSDKGNIRHSDWTVKSYWTEHSDTLRSVCYRLEEGKKVFAYSGDVKSSQGILEAAKDAGFAVIEATLPPEILGNHIDAYLTGEIAEKARVENLVLTHISPEYRELYTNLEIKKQAGSGFSGKVLIAKELMRLNLS